MSPPRPDEIADLERFYAVLDRLLEQQNGYRRLHDCTSRMHWPARGVYFFFEPGEFRTDTDKLRVVRVGTHALTKGSKVTLWQRLQMHKGTPDGGSHHRSIFRLHVGSALLARGGFPPEIGETWGRGSSSGSDDIRAIERPLERAVSAYIGAMPFLVLAADDEPGPTSVRGFIERNSIGLLSSSGFDVDPPSPNWLGWDCQQPAVQQSGLWNINHVGETYDPAFLDRFETLVEARVMPHA